MQVHGSVDQKLKDIQNDKLTSIFDEWLNNEWHSSSLTASPLHENKKETPDWMEWDPLSKQQHGMSCFGRFSLAYCISLHWRIPCFVLLCRAILG